MAVKIRAVTDFDGKQSHKMTMCKWWQCNGKAQNIFTTESSKSLPFGILKWIDSDWATLNVHFINRIIGLA